MLGIMKLGQTGWFDVHMDNVEFVDRINMNVQTEWWQEDDAIVDTYRTYPPLLSVNIITIILLWYFMNSLDMEKGLYRQ